MSDEKKVAPRAFEPPPWEREAFEALARKRAEEQAAPAPGEQPPADAAKPAAPAVDDKQVQVMLLELGREETRPTRNVQLVARIAAVITGLVGAGMLTGGILALQKAGGSSVGVMGSGALSVFGMCFFGMAAWVWVRSNHVRGSR